MGVGVCDLDVINLFFWMKEKKKGLVGKSCKKDMGGVTYERVATSDGRDIKTGCLCGGGDHPFNSIWILIKKDLVKRIVGECRVIAYR